MLQPLPVGKGLVIWLGSCFTNLKSPSQGGRDVCCDLSRVPSGPSISPNAADDISNIKTLKALYQLKMVVNGYQWDIDGVITCYN